MSVEIIHLIPHPVSAKRFAEPLVLQLLAEGREVELWVEPAEGLEHFYDSLSCPKRTATFNLSVNPLRMLIGAINLWKMMKVCRPQAIQAHLTRGALIPLFVGRLLRVPVRIYHNHGIPYIGYSGPLRVLLRTVEWLNCRLSTHVLTVSDGMRHIFVQDKLAPADKCRMLGPGSACGIDISAQQEIIDKGSFKQVLGISPASFIALYVGRPHRRKGFDAILATWAQTFKDANAVLLLAGIGTEDVLRVLPDLPANIRPLGYLADLSPYYAAADVVVLPSEHEGFGYSLLEGASYGCCLIASRIPGPDAIVQDGANGFLIQVGDSKALATSLLRLVHDPDLCRQLGANARMSAEKFERAEILALYGKYMRSILGIKN